jgi:outer membrane protein OmpA-like peptidoglycan-associated protein
MKLTATFIRPWYAILTLCILCAPGTAHAQPADDPGLSEAPPPPPPPPPQPTPSPTPPPTTSVPSRPSDAGRLPSTSPYQGDQLAPAAPPEVHETKQTQVTFGPTTKDERDIYDRLAAPTATGAIGLFHTMTGDVGLPNHLRVGINLQVFKQDSFLISGNATTMGDSNSRFLGNLTIGYTPWKYLELYLAIFNASNQNTRTDPGRTDPEVILSLGDVGAGVKGRVPLAKWMDLGLNLGLKFFNSVSAVSVEGAATNFSADAIASFDLRHAELTKMVPLRFHLNFGYLYDGSINLLPAGQCAISTSNDVCIRSRVVETFGYGIGASRFRLAAAVDAPAKIGPVGLEGFFEYHVEFAVGDGDQTVARALMNDPNVAGDRVTSISLQYVTLGVRVRPVAGLILDTGIDLGLTSPGFQYGPPVPLWNLVLGAAYAFDVVGAARSKIVTTTITRESSRAIIEGKLRGIVRDATTRKPVSGALIKYANRQATPQMSGDDGSFLSYGFPPGPIALDVTRDDYEPAHLESMIPANGETPIEVLLTPRPPQNGIVHIKVSDDAGQPVTTATSRFTSTTTPGTVIDAEGEGAGAFVAKLPPGEYSLDVAAENYLAKQRQVTVVAGQPQSVDVLLRKKPAQSHVSLGKGEIVIKGTIHFGTNNAEIRPDGEQLLDEVADVLVKHPEIKKVRVEGHTDNRGGDQKNLDLSKARAASVVAYLVKQGIDPARLESEGYGASQPLVPNISPANRAKNRRVAFKILDGSVAP